MTLRHCLVTIALSAAVATSLPAHQDDDLDVLLDRLSTYLLAYEAQVSAVIATERYVQEERRVRAGWARRITEAEVMFLRLPGQSAWFGLRDVIKAGGKPVTRNGVSLTELFKNPGNDWFERAAAIVEASSRHNLGGRRTLNMPTVPLEALSPRHHPRYIFKVGGRARVAGVRTRRLEFSEFDEPTLVGSTDGGNLWTRGTAWIDPASGAIWRAEIHVGPDAPDQPRRYQLESSVRVEFMKDAGVELIVPREMIETFWIRGGSGYGKGTYSDYRRFTTSARIVPDG